MTKHVPRHLKAPPSLFLLQLLLNMFIAVKLHHKYIIIVTIFLGCSTKTCIVAPVTFACEGRSAAAGTNWLCFVIAG